MDRPLPRKRPVPMAPPMASMAWWRTPRSRERTCSRSMLGWRRNAVSLSDVTALIQDDDVAAAAVARGRREESHPGRDLARLHRAPGHPRQRLLEGLRAD